MIKIEIENRLLYAVTIMGVFIFAMIYGSLIICSENNPEACPEAH